VTAARPAARPAIPDGYWPNEDARRILDKTLSFRLESDLADLSPAERLVLDRLVAVGRILDDLNAEQRHHQALPARRELRKLHERLGQPARTADLLDLEDLFQGPIATTLENDLVPFLPVDPWTEGKNVYPWAIGRDEIEAHLAAHPEDRPSILGLHTIVRRSSPAALKRDLATIRAHPELALLHPGLVPSLEARAAHPTRHALYAVPFSVAWPDQLVRASGLLAEAAVAIGAERRDLATFLRLRAVDLLSDDNEAGDAAWVRGDIGRIDAVIGAYETYDDDLFGAKGFFGLTLFLRDEAETAALRRAMDDLQEIEASLPYQSRRRVRSDIPAGSYDVLAAFGQGQSTAAEILPNDPDLMRKYGRKILVRRNLYTNPDSLVRARARWESAMERDFHGDLSPEGRYQQVVWHEIGHYLGPEVDREGRSIEDQLEDDSAPVEELKAELISQYAAHRLRDLGHLSAEEARGIGAGGILASLRPVRPIRSQPYPTLWLMEFNFFLDRGLLIYEDGKVGVRWERHDETVKELLGEVLAIQESGSKGAAATFIERWSGWDERHEALATSMRASEKYRYSRPLYGLLDEPGASSRR
jgi:hypothetical protein